jgi:hypothetical protein
MSLLLTDHERERFAAYLEAEAESADGIAAQMETIRTHEAIIKRFRLEAIAARIIAAKLRATESFTCGARKDTLTHEPRT